MINRPYLAALGWVGDEFPWGNRLRWHLHPEENNFGTFRGLPESVSVERAFLDESLFFDTSSLLRPTGAFPPSWWNEDLGDVETTEGLPSHFTLPVSVQGLRFNYAGSNTLMRVYNSTGELIQEQHIHDGQSVFLERHDIKELLFYEGKAALNDCRYLDLFAGHADDLDYDTIAIFNVPSTIEMDHAEVYNRYPGPPTMDPEEWVDFQENIVQPALVSTPANVLDTPDIPPPWIQFQSLLAIRWEYAQLYCLGFVDGPQTPQGAQFDQIFHDHILDAIPVRPVVYRVRVAYDNPAVILLSNPAVVPPIPAFPLFSPTFSYANSSVQLFGGKNYREKNQMAFKSFDQRVIGFEIVEEFAKSDQIGSPAFTEQYTFRGWRPEDNHELSHLTRMPVVSFYDIQMRFQARSLDGWDRVSDYGNPTAWETPEFIHSPEPPPPLSAWYTEGKVTIIANNDHQSFRDWIPDHAVDNTPGSQLEVLRQIGQPAIERITIHQPPVPYLQHAPQRIEGFALPIPNTLANPDQFIGGYLIAGDLRATIEAIHNDDFIFSVIADGGHRGSFFDVDEIVLQQSPDHESLFKKVASFPIHDLPERLVFADDFSPLEGRSAVHHYALQVNMVILKGGLSNLVSVIRMPEQPEKPPQFDVDFLGVDFYDRTLVRVTLSKLAQTGKYSLYWAPGPQSPSSFPKNAIKGDYGPQAAHHGRYLYEIFSLPVPRNLDAVVTFGILEENDGGFKSPFRLLPPFKIAPYVA